MDQCDSCSAYAPVLIDSEAHGIEGSFCPSCCNYSPEAILDLWIDHDIDLCGRMVPYIIEGSSAPCCEHGRQTPNPYDTVFVCPVHKTKTIPRWTHD